MLVRYGYSHDPPAPWGVWLDRWIVKRTLFTRPELARGGEQGQNVSPQSGVWVYALAAAARRPPSG
eukprot:3516710-Prymnesium_polylepis.1